MNKYLAFNCILIISVLLCCAPKSTIPVTHPAQSKVEEVCATDTALAPDFSCAPLAAVPVKDWKGLNFIVLQKQPIFCQPGYELYGFSNPELGLTPEDLSELKPENRIPCDQIKGHLLTVTGLYEDGEEWLVSFSDKETGKVITARTHKHSIKEIVPEADLAWAKKRWLNRVVFSRKGTISTLNKENSSFGSLKVRIQDSLLVEDVVPGFTPLPVNPIWLVVKTPQGQQGIIPLRCSWTNTMSDMIMEGDPWESDIIEKDPSKIYTWDEATWEIINNHRVVLEMTKEQVLMSWGKPVKREDVDMDGEKMECWYYAAQMLCFDIHQLVSIKDIQ
ncbi:MAG: hypothetical protein GX267_02605 [Fibrobacter sp.]|jgi:hypothetical protein|nr:hypothetical protein [Fibrobacter sp.]